MPKAKPDQTIVHRIELQQSERDTLEAALAGNFVTNAVGSVGSVLSGLGAALSPFGGALTAIATAWLADKALDEVLDAARTAGEKTKQRIEDEMAAKGSDSLLGMVAWLRATYETGGWDAICNSTFLNYSLARNITLFYCPFLGTDSPQWFIMRCTDFLKAICANRAEHEKFGDTPIDLWLQHYSAEQYGSDAYYYAQQYASRRMPGGGILTGLAGWAKPSNEN